MQRWETGGARKPRQKSRRPAHLPGDAFFGQVTARGRGWGMERTRNPQSKLNGTLADLKLTIYTDTYKQAQTLQCPGFFLSEERVAYGESPHYKDFIILQNMHRRTFTSALSAIIINN